MQSKLTIKKKYTDLPFSHRQPKHSGHCRFVHGHNVTFEFTFAAKELDENGFVVDFGKLKFLKDYLYKMFDHTFLIPLDDPEMKIWEDLYSKNLIDLRIVPDVSAEGLSIFILEKANEILNTQTNNRVSVVEVTVWEDEKNSATATVI